MSQRSNPAETITLKTRPASIVLGFAIVGVLAVLVSLGYLVWVVVTSVFG